MLIGSFSFACTIIFFDSTPNSTDEIAHAKSQWSGTPAESQGRSRSPVPYNQLETRAEIDPKAQ